MVNKIPQRYNDKAKTFLGIIAFFATIFSLVLFVEFTEKREVITKETGHLFWKHTTRKVINHPFSERIFFLIGSLLLISLALFCAIMIIKIIFKQNRQRRYVAIFKGVDEMPVKEVANIMGTDTYTVLEDVQNLIDSDVFTGFYINYKKSSVVNTNYIPDDIKKSILICESCGKRNEVILGISKNCDSCREPLLLNI